MLKTGKILAIAAVLCAAVLFGLLLADRFSLHNGLIRLHVVADSNSEEDQTIKLAVRDAILDRIASDIEAFDSVSQAQAYLQSNLADLESVANRALQAAGSMDTAIVTLGKEAFPMRQYDTFCLPSGVYESLRVTIGSGEGKNWWCVVFPSFCFGATSKDFCTSAVSAGFSDSLANTLSAEREYKLSFFFLDCLGKLENLFHFG